jgi:hypothetical protein
MNTKSPQSRTPHLSKPIKAAINRMAHHLGMMEAQRLRDEIMAKVLDAAANGATTVEMLALVLQVD